MKYEYDLRWKSLPGVDTEDKQKGGQWEKRGY